MRGVELTWSRISIHNAASDGSKSKTNALPSFDDKILARVLTDSASSVMATVRTVFHCPLKSIVITSTRQDDGGGCDEEKATGRGRWSLKVVVSTPASWYACNFYHESKAWTLG